ncbi:MAG: M67 family metallopeptidase [Sphingomonadales bacterium]|nr:M67 family metallopeptidase [Sphingomonadales bacterium]
MDLVVTSGVIATLLAEATRAHPAECCGLLLGTGDRIDAVLPVANVHPEPLRHFEIDPAALIAAHRAARRGGPEVAGYYHSHPDGRAEPSTVDRDAASGDGRIWAIVAGGNVLFWCDGPDGFEKLCSRVADR